MAVSSTVCDIGRLRLELPASGLVCCHLEDSSLRVGLIDLVLAQFSDDLAVFHYNHAVRKTQDLKHVRGGHHDTHPTRRQIDNHLVDFTSSSDVNASGGFIK